MKKIFLLFVTIFSLNFLNAQEFVVIEYELHKSTDKIAFDKLSEGKVSDDFMKQLIDKLFQTFSYQLVTNKNESNFSWMEKINNSQENDMFSKMFPADMGDIGLLYKDLKEKKYLWDKDDDDHLVVSDSLKKFDWQITNEKSEILGYEVRKATAEKDSTKYEAWYASKLNISNGPELYDGLPGLILKTVEIRNTDLGEFTNTYLAVSLKVDKKKKITKPEKGKFISNDEYQKIKEERKAKRNKFRREKGVDKD